MYISALFDSGESELLPITKGSSSKMLILSIQRTFWIICTWNVNSNILFTADIA